MYRGRSAVGVGQAVSFGGNSDCRDAAVARQPKGDIALPCNWTRQLPAPPVFTLPDVRTDDEDRQLAAAQPLAQGPAVAPTDSPACPFPATGASESRDSTARTPSCVGAAIPR